MNWEPHMRRRFVLLDRDGTINVDRHYISRPEQVELLPGAAKGLRELSRLGLGLVVVTNQSGIGRGYFDESALHAVHARLQELLQEAGVSLDGIFFCTHSPTAGCDCRKPAPGLVHKAAEEFGFDPREAFVIGDKPSDIELGRAVGAITLLVRDNESSSTVGAGTRADYDVRDLTEAATVIGRFLRNDPNPGDEAKVAVMHGAEVSS